MRIFRIFISLLLLTVSLTAAEFDDVKLIKSNNGEEIYEITLKNIKISKTVTQDGFENQLIFDNAEFISAGGMYELPVRILTFGLPENGDINVQVLSKSEKTYFDIILPANEQFGIQNQFDLQNTNQVSLENKSRFRDIMTRSVAIHPVQYNAQSRTLKFTERMTIRVVYSGNSMQTTSFKSRGLLDNLYKKMLVNFETSKNWQISRQRKLLKSNALSTGTYYQINITQDGIYKITAQSLNNNGISTSDLAIENIQIFNNGGHTLSLATTNSQYNPPYTQEIPLLVFDVNLNGLFDSNDYLLFYGKNVNGWFYDNSTKKFIHQTHPFDIKNSYYLSVSGTNGKRMSVSELNTLNNTQIASYAMDYFHFEEDKFNILNSGPDWYGRRFSGKSGSYTLNFDLESVNQAGSTPIMELQMKGGSGSHYNPDDKTTYNYIFDISLNGRVVEHIPHINQSFTNSTRLKSIIHLQNSDIISGSNKIVFNYSSSQDGSSVYLDYFSIVYPKNLTAKQNYLNIYHDASVNNTRYQLTGMGNKNDIYILDTTDPLNVKILAKDIVSNQDQLQFDVPSGSEGQNFSVFSLSSASIQNITGFSPFTVNSDLLSSNKQADLIIITDNSLISYGEEIAGLRDHLKTEVVTVNDIYFYFNGGVKDPVALRNFIRYAYYNWQTPSLSYVLLFGDGHYDYRNITLNDSVIVPTFQIYGQKEVNFGTNESRESDLFFVQLETSDNNELQSSIKPSLAVGRLPVENALDAERMVEKLRIYKQNPVKDGWQTTITIVGDDEKVGDDDIEWIHQSQAELIANKGSLNRLNKRKIYLSAYDAIPGGRRYLKPDATQALIDQINRGTLIVNYIGHGSPTAWSHETLLDFDRDYKKINNEGRLPFIVAATCDFGLFDNPHHVSMSEALIWKEKTGCIGILAATRLVYSGENFAFTNNFYDRLFPGASASIPLGDAFIQAISNSSQNVNDQKYHLLADPTMVLADPRGNIEITSISPDTLKALSRVVVKANVKDDIQQNTNFDGGAVLVVNDAIYEGVNTGGGDGYDYNLTGPLIFKGEVSVTDGEIEGMFIVPKSIRFKNSPTGQITVYAWDDNNNNTAMATKNNLLFLGSSSLSPESEGPEIELYFQGQENFSSGDIISANPILIAELNDESGINMTGQLGHKIELRIDENEVIDISESFTYERDSFTKGYIHYALTNLNTGEHTLTLQAYDNLNNRTEKTVNLKIIETSGIVLDDVVNYPNPFIRNTAFTFQTNIPGAEASIKIYTISGRLIEKLDGYITKAGYNEIPWNGLDRDGDALANGVYLYKIIVRDGTNSKEKIEKLVVMK